MLWQKMLLLLLFFQEILSILGIYEPEIMG